MLISVVDQRLKFIQCFLSLMLLSFTTRSFKGVEKCLAPLKPTCSPAAKTQYEGVETASTFMCIEGKEDFLKFRQCFAKSALETRGRKCNKTYTLEMDKAMDISNSRQVRRELVCRSTKELMSCVYDVAKTHCGSKAADWMHTVTRHMFSPLLNEIGCKPESNVGIAIIFGTAFGLFTIMMIIIIASIACRRNQRTNQNIFPMGHLTEYLSFCARGREKHVTSKSATNTRERAYSQSTVVPNFTCIENTDSQQAPQEDTNPSESEGQRLLMAGSTEGAAESLSALTDTESRSTSSDVKNNDSGTKLE